MDLAEASLLKGSPRRYLAWSFGLALAVRLGFTAWFLSRGLGEVYGRDLYYNLALSWLGWAPPFAADFTHPPLYTAFIAATLGLFQSPNPVTVLILQCLLGALTVPLTYDIGRSLSEDRAARVAGWIVAFDPGLIFYAPQLASETLFIAMHAAFFALLLRELKRPVSANTAAVGLWGGLTALCRSVVGGYPAFLFVGLWRARGKRAAFAFCAVLAVGWLAPSIAWSVRNYLKYDRVVPVAAVMGWNMWEGFTNDREEIRRRPHDMAREVEALGIAGDAIARGDHFTKKTLAFVRERPLEAARVMAGKALSFWRPWPYDPHSALQRGALGLYFTVLFALALVGARAVWKDSNWMPVWAALAYYTALHSVFFTALRYRLPLEPLLAVLAAVGGRALTAGGGNGKRRA